MTRLVARQTATSLCSPRDLYFFFIQCAHVEHVADDFGVNRINNKRSIEDIETGDEEQFYIPFVRPRIDGGTAVWTLIRMDVTWYLDGCTMVHQRESLLLNSLLTEALVTFSNC